MAMFTITLQCLEQSLVPNGCSISIYLVHKTSNVTLWRGGINETHPSYTDTRALPLSLLAIVWDTGCCYL